MTLTFAATSLLSAQEEANNKKIEGEKEAHSEIVKEAIDILSKRFDTEVHVHSVVQLSEPDRRNLLLRIYLQSPSGVPKSVLLKQSVSQNSSEQENEHSFGRFARDWAGLEFLSSLNLQTPISPRFYGGSIEHRFILIEDLGEKHLSLVDALTGNNEDLAKDALLRFVTCLGILHANSYGKTEQYLDIIKKIRPGAEWHNISPDLPGLESLFNQLHVDFPESARLEIDEVFKTNLMPGLFTMPIHGDVCPDNLFDNREKNELLFIDFECGFVKSALLDGTCLRMGFPNCWCSQKIPDELIASLENSYRQELMKTIPAASNDAEYNEAYVQACAFWVLKYLWPLKAFLEHETVLTHSETAWAETQLLPQVLFRLQAFIDVAKKHNKLPQLVSIAEQISDELQTRWPNTKPLALYPAFKEY